MTEFESIKISGKLHKKLKNICAKTGNKMYSVLEKRMNEYDIIKKKLDNLQIAYNNLLVAHQKLKKGDEKSE